MDFSGKNVLITGASRGIGRAAAVSFSACGARVAINFRNNREAAAETIDMMQGEGHFAIRADVSNSTATQKMMDAVINEFGRLDIVVNNAGIFTSHPIDAVDYNAWQQSWRETLNTNLLGPANICYFAARHMKEHGGGRIINVSSRGAFRGEPESPAYGASKAGLNALTQSLAQKLAPYNIYIAAVAPGFVDTPMAREYLTGPQGDEIRNQSPLKRVAKPEEVAHGILFLASRGAEFMTGTILDINGASYLRS